MTTNPTWWERRVGALPLTDKQRAVTEATVRALLASPDDKPVAIHVTARDPLQPEIAVEWRRRVLASAEGSLTFVWIERDGQRRMTALAPPLQRSDFGLAKIYDFETVSS